MREILEGRGFGLEEKVDGVRGALAVLGDDELGDAEHLLEAVLRLHQFAPFGFVCGGVFRSAAKFP